MENNHEIDSMNKALKMVCEANLGVVDRSFLCKSLSALEPKNPLCVREAQPLEGVLELLRAEKIGCIMIVDESGKLSGIFSERDFVLKVATDFERLRKQPISDFMTREPMAESMDCTVAFALNLMSLGGFRHLPIVDQQGMPVGAISVKDVVDFIVESFNQDLLNFQTA